MGYGVSISAPLVAAKSIHSTSPSRPKEHKSSRGLVHFGELRENRSVMVAALATFLTVPGMTNLVRMQQE